MRARIWREPRSKYRAKPQIVDGFRFASQAEARRYQQLVLQGLAGELRNLELQPSFPLVVSGADGKRRLVAVYRGDFAYTIGDRYVVEDVKGMSTPVYRLKKRLVEALYGLVVQEVRARSR